MGMKNWKNYIEISTNKMFGKPVFAGTRIPVDLILEKLSTDSIQEILLAYPTLSKEHISASLMFASQSIKNEVFYANAS